MYSDDVCISLFAFVIIWQCTRGKEIFYIMLDKINSIHLINGSIKILLYLVSEIYQFCFWRKKLPYLTVDRKKEFKDVIVTKTRLKNCWYYMCKSMLNHKFSFCVTSWKSQQVFLITCLIACWYATFGIKFIFHDIPCILFQCTAK